MKKLIGTLVAAFVLIGAAPILLLVINITFIPASGWLQTMAYPASILGVVVGIVGAIFVFRTRKTNPRMAHMGWFKSSMTSVGVFFLGWLFGYTFLAVSVPMVHAAALGGDARLPFVVEDPDDFGSRHCRPALELQDMPFMFNQLCGPPPVLVSALSPGDTVYAVGRGTELGVFYNAFSLR